MEGKITNAINSKITQDNKDENKIKQIKNKNNRIFFNSVTGELMNIDDGNEADLYEIYPDMEQYAQDNISQYTDIYQKDKQFFKLWNSFIKSKENTFYKYEDILIEFLNKYSKYLCENELQKYFGQHLVAVYENRQIDNENLDNIIDIMHKLFK